MKRIRVSDRLPEVNMHVVAYKVDYIDWDLNNEYR